jgi:hypothetical protein
LGGDEAVINQARIAVALANKAYTDSGINLQMNLMAVRKVRGEGSGKGWGRGDT